MKVSVVTINYNNVAGLKRTLESVNIQTCNDYELVIVDGGSNDGSKAVIEEYAANHSSVTWVSEPDKGIYNAMNKGVRMSSGEYCIFMNSGDRFYDSNVLEMSMGYLDGTEIISGTVKADAFEREAPKPSEVNLTFFIKAAMNHQSTFIWRKLLVDCPYNESRKIAGDSEFFFQTMVLKNVKYKKIKLRVSYCEVAGESGDIENSIEERLLAIKELLPSRMAYDVDFIKNYHNPFVLKAGRIANKRWIRSIYHIFHK